MADKFISLTNGLTAIKNWVKDLLSYKADKTELPEQETDTMRWISPYYEDGTWLRTIASAPWVDFVQDGVLIFQPLGIALISPFAATPHGKGHPGYQPNHHVPGQYPPSAQPQNGHYGQGQYQTPAQPQKPAIGTNRNSEANRSGTTSTGGARNSVAGAGTASSSTVPGAGAMHGAGALPGAADGHHAPMHGLQPLPHTLSALESALRYGRY